MHSKRQKSVSSCSTSSKWQEKNDILFASSVDDDDPILQTRRLAGDASRKGECWRVDAVNRKTVKDDDSGMLNVPVPKCSQDTRAKVTHKQNQQQQHLPNRDRIKLHIVHSKKAQYGHLLSNHGETARDENRGPIIYKRAEEGRREVAPLWYHPFMTEHNQVGK
jgi:hypothetical protein